MRAMSALDNPNHERFVQELVAGCTQAVAYRAAYEVDADTPHKTVTSRASTVWRRPEVKARYRELMDEVADLVLWSRERATRELMEVREIALDQIRDTRGDAKHYTNRGNRELADLPKTAVTLLLSSTDQLNKMFGVYEDGALDGGKVVIIDDL